MASGLGKSGVPLLTDTVKGPVQPHPPSAREIGAWRDNPFNALRRRPLSSAPAFQTEIMFLRTAHAPRLSIPDFLGQISPSIEGWGGVR